MTRSSDLWIARCKGRRFGKRSNSRGLPAGEKVNNWFSRNKRQFNSVRVGLRVSGYSCHAVMGSCSAVDQAPQ